MSYQPILNPLPVVDTSSENSLTSIDSKIPVLVGGKIPVDSSGTTQPISVASLPLPSGASTSAKQDTAQTSLSSIDTKLTNLDNIANNSYLVPNLVVDIPSTTITTTTTTTAVTPTVGSSYIISIPITAIAGTTPTLDVSIEESDDTGTNFRKIFDLPRIIATGIYRTPPLKLTGNRLRYVFTIAGTTPSFTYSLNRLQLFSDIKPIKQIINRIIDLNTLNTVTPSFESKFLENYQIVINLGAITTTAPSIILEGSDDNINWYPISTEIIPIALSTLSAIIPNFPCNFIRARTSSAGVGVTLGYILIRAY